MACLRTFYDLVGSRWEVRYEGAAQALIAQVRAGERWPLVETGATFVALNLDRIEAGLRWPK